MKNTHTPGPWTHTPSREHTNPNTTRRDIVADSQFGPAFIAGDVSQADARLIASAPDLLSALEGMLEHADMGEIHDEETLCAVNAARAAIAKAKGEA